MAIHHTKRFTSLSSQDDFVPSSQSWEKSFICHVSTTWMRVRQPVATAAAAAAAIHGKLVWWSATDVHNNMDRNKNYNRNDVDNKQRTERRRTRNRAIWNHIVCRWMGGSIWNGTRAYTHKMYLSQPMLGSLLAENSRSRSKRVPKLQLGTQAHSFIPTYGQSFFVEFFFCRHFRQSAVITLVCLIVWNTC